MVEYHTSMVFDQWIPIIINKDLIAAKNKAKFMNDFMDRYLFPILKLVEKNLKRNIVEHGYAAID